MKKYTLFILSIVLMSLVSCSTNDIKNSHISENDALEHYTELLSVSYEDDIHYLECFDINGDGKYSCVSMVAGKTNYEMYGKIVFVNNDDSIVELLSSGLADVFNFACFEENAVLSVEEFYGGSGSLSHIWKVTETGCEKLEHKFMFLKNTSGKDFTIYMSFFEPYHINQKYYLFWDGNDFKEYGAIPMSEDQLSSIDGGSDILEQIRANGSTVDEILYRDNGIININYSKNDIWDNVTLIYKENAVAVDDSEEFYNGSSDSIGGSYGGKYLAAAIPEIAVYPTKFPF